jgi:hypothetical protein
MYRDLGLSIEDYISVSIVAGNTTLFSIVIHLLLFWKEFLVFSIY